MLINLQKVCTTGLAAIALGAVLSVVLPKTPHYGVAVAGPASMGATEIVHEDVHVSDLMKNVTPNPEAVDICHLPALTDDDFE